MSLATEAAVSSRSLSWSARPKATVIRVTRAFTCPVSKPLGANVDRDVGAAQDALRPPRRATQTEYAAGGRPEGHQGGVVLPSDLEQSGGDRPGVVDDQLDGQVRADLGPGDGQRLLGGLLLEGQVLVVDPVRVRRPRGGDHGGHDQVVRIERAASTRGGPPRAALVGGEADDTMVIGRETPPGRTRRPRG